jgi:hypothetical protein
LAGNDLSGDALARVEIPDANLIPAVQTEKLVGGKRDLSKGARPGRLDDLLDAALAKDVNLAGAKLGLAGADGQQRLDGIVGQTAAMITLAHVPHEVSHS